MNFGREQSGLESQPLVLYVEILTLRAELNFMKNNELGIWDEDGVATLVESLLSVTSWQPLAYLFLLPVNILTMGFQLLPQEI